MFNSRIALHWQILIALMLAVIFGLLFKDYVPYISWMGDLFLRMLKMIVVPLIISSIISGIANIGSHDHFGRLGLKTMGYYIFTSVAAILVSLLFVNIFHPGDGIDLTGMTDFSKANLKNQCMRDVLLGIVPDNIFKSMANNELLSVIFFSILLGIFIPRLSSRHSDQLTGFFNSIFELFMKITLFVIKLAPYGIFGLIIKVVADQKDFTGLMVNLGSFVLTVMFAILVHAFIILPLLVKYFGKSNPMKHFRNMSTPLLTAFSTASSAAALPLSLNEVRDKSGVSEKITNFTLPIGATVNMDGTAIYIVAVVMFIAQAQGIKMGIAEQFIILLTALLTSIGTAAIPMASLVIITIILDILKLPVEMIALILPVDRILDMFRTASNVWSDTCGAVIIAKSEGEKLKV